MIRWTLSWQRIQCPKRGEKQNHTAQKRFEQTVPAVAVRPGGFSVCLQGMLGCAGGSGSTQWLVGCPQPPGACVCWDALALHYTVLLLKLLPSLILSLLTSGRCRTNQLRAVPVAIKPPHHNPARALRAIYATHSRHQLSRFLPANCHMLVNVFGGSSRGGGRAARRETRHFCCSAKCLLGMKGGMKEESEQVDAVAALG